MSYKGRFGWGRKYNWIGFVRSFSDTQLSWLFMHSRTVTYSQNSMKIILLPLFDLESLRNLTRLSDQWRSRQVLRSAAVVPSEPSQLTILLVMVRRFSTSDTIDNRQRKQFCTANGHQIASSFLYYSLWASPNLPYCNTSPTSPIRSNLMIHTRKYCFAEIE